MEVELHGELHDLSAQIHMPPSPLKFPEILCKLSGICIMVALGVPFPCTETITALTAGLNSRTADRALVGTGTIPLGIRE